MIHYSKSFAGHWTGCLCNIFLNYGQRCTSFSSHFTGPNRTDEYCSTNSKSDGIKTRQGHSQMTRQHQAHYDWKWRDGTWKGWREKPPPPWRLITSSASTWMTTTTKIRKLIAITMRLQGCRSASLLSRTLPFAGRVDVVKKKFKRK